MKKIPLTINSLLLALFLVAVVSAVWGDVFKFSGNRVQSVFTKGKEHTVLTGNAHITSDANDIRANEIELYGDDMVYADCHGAVHLVNLDRGLELTSDELFYDRDRKIAQVRGNAIMVDRKNEVVVKGGYIENHEDDDVTFIQIGVRILKENMSCRSEFAKYLRKIDTLELTGMPVVFWKGDEYRAQKITINLKKDEVKMEGSVEGEVTTKNKEEPSPSPSASPAPESQNGGPQNANEKQGAATPEASPAPTPTTSSTPSPSSAPLVKPSPSPTPAATPSPSPGGKP